MSKKFYLFLGILLPVIVAGGILLCQEKVVAPVACTMEAKICPDGSAVGRSGPKCEFTACPTATGDSTADTNTPTQIANPASVNCLNAGGQLVIDKRGDGGEYGLCYFQDNRACEEWAMMRGDCPIGGVKTTGFDGIDQKYCAWSGGRTFAVPNSICIFKDGSTCSTLAFYNGECSTK